MDVKGANYIMYPAFIVFTAGMLLLSFAHNSIALLLSGVLIGLGFGNMQSCTQAIAVKLTPLIVWDWQHRLSLYFLMQDLDSVLIYLDSSFHSQATVHSMQS